MKFIQASILKAAGWVSKNILRHLSNPWNHKLITAEDYRELKTIMRPGTIIVTRTRGELTNMFIPGFFKHAAIVVNETEVVEATSNGVRRSDLIDFMLSKDYVAAVHPKFANPSVMAKAAKVAEAQIGKDYDFDIIMSDLSSFYCSELVYFAYDEVVDGVPFTPREILGRDTIEPADFYNATKFFNQVWASESVTKLK